MEAKPEQDEGNLRPIFKGNSETWSHRINNIREEVVIEEIKSGSYCKVMFYKALGSDWENLANTCNHGKHTRTPVWLL